MPLSILKSLIDPARAGNYIEYLHSGSLVKVYFPELYTDVLRAMQLLRKQGLQTGDRAGIRGNNLYDWVVVDLACLVSGIITVPVDVKHTAAEVDALAERFSLKILYTDKALPGLQANTELLTGLVSRLRNEPLPNPAPAEVEGTAEDIISIVPTSGTTSTPKYIGYRKKWLTSTIGHSQQIFGFGPGDKFLVFLPLNVILQRVYVYASVLQGSNVLLLRGEQVLTGMKQGKPTVIIAIPAFFEAFASGFLNKIGGNKLHVLVYGIYKLLNRLGLWKKFKPFAAVFGGEARYLMSGSAPLKLKTLQFYNRIGLPLYEGYGMSEAGMIALNTPAARRAGSVGRIFPDKQVQLSETGEVIVHSDAFPNSRYYFPEDNTAGSVYQPGNTIHSGDIGYMDADGFLYLKGRKDNVIVLNSGNKVNPESIEEIFNSGLSDVSGTVVLGNARDYLGLLVFSGKTINEKQLAEQINTINRPLPDYQKIMRFTHIPVNLEAGNNTLTASLKLNRKYILEAYGRQIEDLYKK